jgi:pyrimidine oxygenase
MKDCQSKPKPLSKPRPEIVCAGMSDRGFQFSVREADVCFIGGRTPDERRDASLRAKKAAEAMGKTVKTYAMCTVIHGDTDAKAAGHGRALQGRRRHGRDPGHAGQLGRAGRQAGHRAAQQGAFMTHTVIGSPATCREQIEEFVTDCELDGLMLIFPDYVEGLTMFGSEILPGLRAVYS